MQNTNDETNYYRNKVILIDIEPDSLWKLNGEMLELVDDDQYIVVNFAENKELFYEEP